MSQTIDITEDQRRQLLTALGRFLPGVTVWAYGSRAQGTARKNSDLDLVAFTAPDQQDRVYALKEALDEGDIPFRIDLHVWDELPETFHQIISRQYVVIQPQSDSDRKLGALGYGV